VPEIENHQDNPALLLDVDLQKIQQADQHEDELSIEPADPTPLQSFEELDVVLTTAESPVTTEESSASSSVTTSAGNSPAA
jgi:hypothetical protein